MENVRDVAFRIVNYCSVITICPSCYKAIEKGSALFIHIVSDKEIMVQCPICNALFIEKIGEQEKEKEAEADTKEIN
jgi:RNase P subunit RPR2